MADETEIPAEVSEDAMASDPPGRSATGLRIWPAVILLAAMPLLRSLMAWVESPGIGVFMMSFVGPAALAVGLLVWWCFASRATLKEKVLGLVAVIIVGGLSVAFLHFSLKGMFAIFMVVPTGLAAFGVGLVVASRSPRYRLPIALLASLIGFGFWDFKQNEGTTGAFEPQLLWRWEATAEQKYLKELASREKAEVSDGEATPITLEAAEWPAFRGADRTGVVSGVTLASTWDSTTPKQLWRQKIGPGWSSFSVAGNRIFTQEQRGDEEAVVCLDADTGKLIWDVSYPSRFWEAIAGAGPRATPTIANEGVFALGADGILLKLDALTGEEKWRRDLKEDASRKPPTWGFSASPLVTGGLVIVHAGGDGNKGLIAYNVENGEIAWSVPSGNHSYSSAQATSLFGQQGILMLTNDGLQFLDGSNGETLWNHEWALENYRTLQPLVVDNAIFMTTSIQEGTRRITVSCDAEGEWTTEESWTSQAMKSDYNDYVHHDGFIYGFDRGIFTCMDAETGDRKWKRGRYGNGQVILLKDSGQLLVITEKGEVVLIDASPEKLIETSKFQAIEGKTWNHPVLIGNRLYVRNAQEAACYELAVETN